ncbi:MAG: AzlD domain-containing protein [Acidimicrobiales bacterium]|jgi:branched-subunit amino acid transport protein|nr:AzlD domain-containing protein [Acidimicrobiales bacterium]
MSWTALLVLAAGAYGCKALGVFVGSRWSDEGVAARATLLLPPALLAALVVVQTFSSGSLFTLDARVAGVAAGAVAAWLGRSFVTVIVLAAAVTAALRALG